MDFREEIPTVNRVPNWRYWQRLWNHVADCVNRLTPGNFVASPAFPLARRDEQNGVDLLTYTQTDVQTAPAPALGYLVVLNWVTASAGQLQNLRLFYDEDDDVLLPAGLDITVQIIKNGAAAVGVANVTAGVSSTVTDLTGDADATFVAGDRYEARMTTAGVWTAARVNLTVQVESREPLAAL